MPPYNMTREQMLEAVSGGVLVSLSVCLFYIVFGKLMGMTSLLKQFLTFKYNDDFAIRMTVFAGIIFSAAMLKQLYHEHFIRFWPFDRRAFDDSSDVGVLIVSGLLVGFGAVMSGGCTFGQGITGIARLNIQSIVSVIIFSASAYYTNKWNLVKMIPTEATKELEVGLPDNINADWYIQSLILVPFLFYVLSKDKSLVGITKFIIAFLIGVLAGLGMMVGGLTRRQQVLHIFTYNRDWDPTILVFFGTTIAINFVVFTILRKAKLTPIFAEKFDDPRGKFSIGLVFGSICFGVGWGLSGLCLGPSFLLIPLKNIKVPVYWGLSLCAGIKIAQIIQAIGIKSKVGKVPPS